MHILQVTLGELQFKYNVYHFPINFLNRRSQYSWSGMYWNCWMKLS
jgi:hypothetical protein